MVNWSRSVKLDEMLLPLMLIHATDTLYHVEVNAIEFDSFRQFTLFSGSDSLLA